MISSMQSTFFFLARSKALNRSKVPNHVLLSSSTFKLSMIITFARELSYIVQTQEPISISSSTHISLYCSGDGLSVTIISNIRSVSPRYNLHHQLKPYSLMVNRDIYSPPYSYYGGLVFVRRIL